MPSYGTSIGPLSRNDQTRGRDLDPRLALWHSIRIWQGWRSVTPFLLPFHRASGNIAGGVDRCRCAWPSACVGERPAAACTPKKETHDESPEASPAGGVGPRPLPACLRLLPPQGGGGPGTPPFHPR